MLERRKPLPQMLHTNGRAPVWLGILRWMVSVYFVLKVLPHCSHLYTGFDPPAGPRICSFPSLLLSFDSSFDVPNSCVLPATSSNCPWDFEGSKASVLMFCTSLSFLIVSPSMKL